MWKREEALATAAIVLAGVGFLYFLFVVFTASGKIDYCYLREGYGASVCLVGHRNWRDDTRIGCFESIQRAIAGAELIKCPLDDEIEHP